MIVLDASALVDVVIGQPAARWVLDRLAEHLGIPLLTTDLRLARAAAPCEILRP